MSLEQPAIQMDAKQAIATTAFADASLDMALDWVPRDFLALI
jgi:hypothetical protein